MFRALREAFEGGPASSQYEFVENQRKLYYEQLPNMILTSDAAYNTVVENGEKFRKAVSFADPITGGLDAAVDSPAAYFRSGEIPQEIKDRQQYCVTTPQDVLATAQNPAQKLRCGWLYGPAEQGRPEVSKGFLGTSRGPLEIFSPPAAKWYWNIEEAEKAQHIDLCKRLQRCEDVERPEFAGKCGYCPSIGQGIPIRNGAPRYPADRGCMEPALMSAGKCLQPIQPMQGSAAAELRQLEGGDVCMPLTNGTISRQCLMKKTLDAKCERDGALYTALAASLDPSNYIGGVMEKKAYTTYQGRAQVPLPQELLRNGRMTAETALQSFSDVYKAATGSGTVAAAARDLCFKKGEFDSFDFCTELQPNTRGPFSLECLQKEFKLAGGQTAGDLYPSAKTLTVWNSLPTWGAVRTRIADLAAAINSPDDATQTAALKSFLGIQRTVNEYARIGVYNMYDTLWFVGNNMAGRTNDRVLYGRRIYSSDLMPGLNNVRGDLNGIPVSDNVLLVVMATLYGGMDRIKWRMTTDDGAMITMNRFMPTVDEWDSNKIRDEPAIFSRWYRQAPTTHISTVDMELKRNKPNYMKIAWTQGRGRTVLDLAIGAGDAFSAIPGEQILLNQEPDAPYVSFETRMRPGFMNNMLQFQEYRNPEFFYFNRMEGVQYESVRGNYMSAPGAQPFIVLSNSKSYIQLGTPILPVAWKTMTVAFRLDGPLPASIGYLLRLGKITAELRYVGSAVYVYGLGERVPVQIEKNVWYLLSIAQVPNEKRVVVSIVPFSTGQPTTINVQLLLNQSFAANHDAATVLNEDAGVLEIGGMDSSAPVSVAWVHLFDRLFTNDMMKKELGASWARAYM
jgi:hypothetical protein